MWVCSSLHRLDIGRTLFPFFVPRPALDENPSKTATCRGSNSQPLDRRTSAMPRWCVAAVSGATCGGKTTIAHRLHAALPGSRLISQDDYFLPESDPRHRLVAGLGHFNWDTLSALDMDRMSADVTAILKTSPPGMLILEGFLLLNDPRIRGLCDVRIFITLEKETCWQRRKHRSYDPPDVPGYFDACVWPMYEEHEAALRRETGGEVTFLDGGEGIEDLYRRVEAEVKSARAECGVEGGVGGAEG